MMTEGRLRFNREKKRNRRPKGGGRKVRRLREQAYALRVIRRRAASRPTAPAKIQALAGSGMN